MLRVHTSMCGACVYRKRVPLSETEKRGVLSTFLSAVKNVSSLSERGKYEPGMSPEHFYLD